MTPSLSASTAIATTLALLDQFTISLLSTSEPRAPESSNVSPLPLLTASATALKSQTTKLSLITLTAPFTSSAISTNLAALNDSILPSIVTGTLLITPANYTTSFASEATRLTLMTLRNLETLVQLVQRRDQDGKPRSEVSEKDKKAITEATGKVWEDCGDLTKFSHEGFSGFVVRKATQWLELMKDAVKELQEWDPEEDEGSMFGDIGSDTEPLDTNNKEKLDESSTIKAGVKDQALKVLTRIPQSVHVVIKQRLQKMPNISQLSLEQKSAVDSVVRKTRQISECIDESAEGMYMGDLEVCLKKAGEARQLTIDIVESVVKPWLTAALPEKTAEAKEDQYIKRALDWIRQVDATSEL